MNVDEAIRTRRSVREFTDQGIDEKDILAIIEAGHWAPSGLNNQPWKVVVIRCPKVRAELAGQTKYSRIVNAAQVNLAVFYDEEAGYNNTKDILAIGAFIQNMLLTIHSMEYGACWLGEILNQEEAVNEILGVPRTFRLMAVVAIGKPSAKERSSTRRPVNEIIYKSLD